MKNFQNRDNKNNGQRGGRFEERKSVGRFDRKEDSKPVFYGKSRGGDRSTNKEVRMYKATCSDCKKLCDVPFKPSGDKPVFCSNCFGAKRSGYDPTQHSIPHDPRKTSQEYVPSIVNPLQKESKNLISLENYEIMKKQIAELSSRLDIMSTLVEKILEAKKEEVLPVKVSTPKTTKAVTASKKVVAKKVVAKKTTDVKKVAVKKPLPVKKVAAKKIK